MPSAAARTSKVSISRKVILGAVFTLFMLLLLALTAFISTRRFLSTSEQVAETREVLERAERVRRYLMEMESGVRGYLLSGQQEQLDPFEHGQSFIMMELQTLRGRTGQDGEQLARLERLRMLVQRMFAFYERAILARQAGGLPAASQAFTQDATRIEAVEIFGGLTDELSDFEQAERSRLREQKEMFETIGSVTTSLVVGGTSLTYIALMVACLFILRDIAERRRAEEELAVERNLLRSMMDTIPDAIFVKDRDGRYTRDNAAHRLLLGLQEGDAVVGKRDEDLFPPELAGRYASDDAEILAGHRKMLDVEEPARVAGGRSVWLETTKVPLLDAEGRPQGIVGISRDITQRRQDQERLRHYAAQLTRSNDELQNFASVASHDLQEPLRKIQAFGDRIRSRHAAALDESGQDYLTRMLDAAQRMQTLIQDLLKLSRVTTRALPFERCDLDDTARGVLRDLELPIATTGARITLAGLPTIEADPTQMRQLLQNLIANALKFQRPGVRPEIQVTARTFTNHNADLPGIPRDAILCEIRISDNGIGFDAQFAEQIFSPFKRLHARAEYEGSGIGLTLCRKITDRHRGRIQATSAAGRGAIFTVTLPTQQPTTTPA